MKTQNNPHGLLLVSAALYETRDRLIAEALRRGSPEIPAERAADRAQERTERAVLEGDIIPVVAVAVDYMQRCFRSVDEVGDNGKRRYRAGMLERETIRYQRGNALSLSQPGGADGDSALERLVDPAPTPAERLDRQAWLSLFDEELRQRFPDRTDRDALRLRVLDDADWKVVFARTEARGTEVNLRRWGARQIPPLLDALRERFPDFGPTSSPETGSSSFLGLLLGQRERARLPKAGRGASASATERREGRKRRRRLPRFFGRTPPPRQLHPPDEPDAGSALALPRQGLQVERRDERHGERQNVFGRGGSFGRGEPLPAPPPARKEPLWLGARHHLRLGDEGRRAGELQPKAIRRRDATYRLPRRVEPLRCRRQHARRLAPHQGERELREGIAQAIGKAIIEQPDPQREPCSRRQAAFVAWLRQPFLDLVKLQRPRRTIRSIEPREGVGPPDVLLAWLGGVERLGNRRVIELTELQKPPLRGGVGTVEKGRLL